MELSIDIKNYIRNHALQDKTKECCGIIVKNWPESSIVLDSTIFCVKCNNVSESPEKSFIIDYNDVKKYGLENIVAFYHSHPLKCEFSVGDMAFSEKLDRKFILYCIETGEFKIYEPNGHKTPYIDRTFFIGILDCFSLLIDYYKRELNIELPDINDKMRYEYKQWKNKDYICNYTILKDYFLSNGFIKVDNLKKHDVVEVKFKDIKFPSHVGVYLGDYKILQHIYEYSSIENYNNSLKRMTTAVYRHKSLM